MKRFVDTHATILVTFREIDATSRHNVSYNRQLRSVCVYLRTETEIRAWWKFQTILKRIYDYSQPRNMQNKVFCNDILIAIFHSRNLSCLSTILLVWLWSSRPSFTRPFFHLSFDPSFISFLDKHKVKLSVISTNVNHAKITYANDSKGSISILSNLYQPWETRSEP